MPEASYKISRKMYTSLCKILSTGEITDVIKYLNTSLGLKFRITSLYIG